MHTWIDFFFKSFFNWPVFGLYQFGTLLYFSVSSRRLAALRRDLAVGSNFFQMTQQSSAINKVPLCVCFYQQEIARRMMEAVHLSVTTEQIDSWKLRLRRVSSADTWPDSLSSTWLICNVNKSTYHLMLLIRAAVSCYRGDLSVRSSRTNLIRLHFAVAL